MDKLVQIAIPSDKLAAALSKFLAPTAIKLLEMEKNAAHKPAS